MTDNTKLAELKIPQDMLDLSKRLEKSFKIGEGGQINIDKTLFAETLPEGLTMDDVNRVQKHTENLVGATVLALGHTATPYLKKHKDAKNVELTFPMGKSSFSAVYDRMKEYPGRGEGAEKIIKYGTVTADFTTHGAVGNRGTLKKLRGYLNDFAAEQLGK